MENLNMAIKDSMKMSCIYQKIQVDTQKIAIHGVPNSTMKST